MPRRDAADPRCGKTMLGEAARSGGLYAMGGLARASDKRHPLAAIGTCSTPWRACPERPRGATIRSRRAPDAPMRRGRSNLDARRTWWWPIDQRSSDPSAGPSATSCNGRSVWTPRRQGGSGRLDREFTRGTLAGRRSGLDGGPERSREAASSSAARPRIGLVHPPRGAALGEFVVEARRLWRATARSSPLHFADHEVGHPPGAPSSPNDIALGGEGARLDRPSAGVRRAE